MRPTLNKIGLGGLAAERLLIGTALEESRLTFIDQIERGGDKRPGPAFGIYQMERATHDDLWKTYMVGARSWIAIPVAALAIGKPDADQMQGNLYYATAMARVLYRRAPGVMPDPDDAMAMALYHKKYYNTVFGASDPETSVINFKLAIKEVKP